MTRNPPSLPDLPTPPVESDIERLTDALFQDIADVSANARLRETISLINTHLRTIRPYEGAYITNRRAEYEALSEAWTNRDIDALRALTAAYFQRRRALVTQIAKLITATNSASGPH